MGTSLEHKREQKHLRFEFKDLTPEGKFVGLAAVYEIPDLGNDVIQKGALTKSIKRSKGRVPILWQHDTKEPIGIAEMEDTDVGVRITGQLSMSVPAAQKAYALLKDKVIDGLSIGFESLKDKVENGIRYLSELKLWEVSVVTFPMHPDARISSVKAIGGDGLPMDFDTVLAGMDTMAKGWQMMSALGSALCDIRCSDSVTPEEAVTMSSDTIGQFSDAYLAWLPDYLAMDSAMEMYSTVPPEAKAGRILSAATRKRIADAIDRLKALLAETEPKAAEIPEQKVVTPEPDPEPVAALLKELVAGVTETLAVPRTQ